MEEEGGLGCPMRRDEHNSLVGSCVEVGESLGGCAVLASVFELDLCERAVFVPVEGCATGQGVCIAPLEVHGFLSGRCAYISLGLSLCVCLCSLGSVPGLSACAPLPALGGGGICPSPQH